MPVTRKADWVIQDFTAEVNKIPRPWSLVDSMNMFTEMPVTSTTVTIDVITEKTDTYGDVRRGADRTKVGPETTKAVSLQAPFFALDAAITPVDVQNLRQAGTTNDPATIANLRLRIMERIRRYHGALKEKCLVEALLGSTYAPNGTIAAQNYYTIFGESQTTVDFVFSSGTEDVLGKAESAWGAVIDNAQDGAGSYEVVALCSPGWFQDFISHPKVAGAYEDYLARVNPNRERPNGGSIYRQFEHGNVLYIEYRGAFNGVNLIPTDEAYFFPRGIADQFDTYFAPGDLLDAANQPGQELYMIEVRDPRGRRLDIESDSSMLMVNKRPSLTIRATKS